MLNISSLYFDVQIKYFSSMLSNASSPNKRNLSGFTQTIFRGLHTMSLNKYYLREKTYSIKPVFANACGNTFLIYDFIEKCPSDQTKHAIWKILKKADHIDDGLLLCKANNEHNHLQVKMHVLEPDGTEADFCGNGARSVGAYLLNTYGKSFPEYSLISRRGKHEIIDKNGTCFIKMGVPILDEKPIKYVYKGIEHTFIFVDAVEPHLITKDFFCREYLTEIGDSINGAMRDRFPQGINVNCLRPKGEANIDVLTYERGLYRITQACGTGSTAACATALNYGWVSSNQKTYQISVLGGRLELLLDQNNEFWLGGDVLLDKVKTNN